MNVLTLHIADDFLRDRFWWHAADWADVDHDVLLEFRGGVLLAAIEAAPHRPAACRVAFVCGGRRDDPASRYVKAQVEYVTAAPTSTTEGVYRGMYVRQCFDRARKIRGISQAARNRLQSAVKWTWSKYEPDFSR